MSPDPQPPGLIQERWLQPVHVVLLQGVLAVVEEGELVVDLGDPRVLAVILAFSYSVNFFFKLLQTWLKSMFIGKYLAPPSTGTIGTQHYFFSLL